MIDPFGAGRPLVLGVVNVTPDSFSDGGEHDTPAAALAHARALLADGADLIDVGGESTRPGAARVDPAVEQERVLGVVAALAEAGVGVSIDTMHASTAAAAVDAGAIVVNDVSGGLADPDLLGVVARTGVGYVLMHWRGHARSMQRRAVYADVVADVRRELDTRLRAALDAGVDPARIVLDPGPGFAKTSAHNWELLRRWHALTAPLPTAPTAGWLLAVSRKRFLGELADAGGRPRSVVERDPASAALAGIVAAGSAAGRLWGVRAHEAGATADALAVAAALQP